VCGCITLQAKWKEAKEECLKQPQSSINLFVTNHTFSEDMNQTFIKEEI
jgi:hypothetical protein